MRAYGPAVGPVKLIRRPNVRLSQAKAWAKRKLDSGFPRPHSLAPMDGSESFARLVALMHRLRAPGGCPWDAEQTHDSLAPYLIEECYEVIEALERSGDEALCEELGDVLLQVVFHSELATERGAFTIDDVVERLSDKLVRRHPHVFENVVAKSAGEVVSNWSRIKHQERAKSDTNGGASVLAGVPKALPALLRAHRSSEKASSAGFDWPDAEGARRKITEELAELDHAVGGHGSVADEIGDLLFAVSSYARLSGLNSEGLLQAAIERFRTRFEAMETVIEDSGRDIHDLGADELDQLWSRVKEAQA